MKLEEFRNKYNRGAMALYLKEADNYNGNLVDYWESYLLMYKNEFEDFGDIEKLVITLDLNLRVEHNILAKNFIEFCESEIRKIKNTLEHKPQQYKTGTKLSIQQVALKLVYEGKHLTRETAREIIKEYGHNSGDGLYNAYSKYSNSNDRTAHPNPFTERKLKNKINLFEFVVNILEEPYRLRAESELDILKSYKELI
jgi:hypothetical protein